MQQDLENLVLDVQAKLSIGRSALASAQTVWRDTKNALLSGYDKGEKPSTVVALGDEFLSARRFCDDARELLAFHNLKHASDPASRPSPTVSSTEEVEFFAIDAHLLRAFAQHGSTVDLRRLHRGFSHFPSEPYENEDQDSVRYRMFVYNSVFRDDYATLLTSSRQEITNTIAFLSDEVLRAEKANDGGLEQKLISLLDELEVAAQIAKFTKSSEWLKKSFLDIVRTSGALLGRQTLALARYLRVLRENNFQLPEALLQKFVGHHSQSREKAELATRLVQHFRKNPSLAAGSLKELVECYRVFVEESELGERRTVSQDHLIIRGGELDDLRALHEVRLINACFDVAGLSTSVRYVTLSSRIFNFTRAFDRTILRVPLVHPRNAFMFREEEALEKHLPHITDVCASPASSAHWMVGDGRITKHEILQFEKQFKHQQEAVQHTFIHTFFDEPHEIKELEADIRHVFNGLPDAQKSRLEIVLVRLLESYRIRPEEAYGRFEQESDSLAEAGWRAYWSWQDNKVAMLAHFIEGRHDSGAVQSRLVCLPLSERYRNLFVIHDERICTDLRSRHPGEKLFWLNFKEVLMASEKAASKVGIQASRADKAVVHYLRALVAASNGDGTMCFSQVRQGREKLALTVTDSESIETAASFFGFSVESLTDRGNPQMVENSRLVLLDQELLYLNHMAMRILSEASGAVARRIGWLERAAKDLRKSAKLTLALPEVMANYRTSLNPISVRQSLAAASLIIAFLVQGL